MCIEQAPNFHIDLRIQVVMPEVLLGIVFPYSNSLDAKKERLKRILPLGA